jgi:hypothetical protein
MGEIVVKESKTRINQVDGNKHTMYLRKDFVTDSAFPFKPKQELVVKIVGKTVIIEESTEVDGGEKTRRGKAP